MNNLELRRSYETGSQIFLQGDVADFACIIESGSVEVTVAKDDCQQQMAVLRKGAIFGEMALIDDSPRSATVTTLEPTVLIIINQDQFSNKIAQTHPMIRLFMRVILDRFRATEKVLIQFTGQNGNKDGLNIKRKEDAASYQKESDSLVTQLKKEEDLKMALQNEEFEVYFQPIISMKSGKIAGHEALVRWIHPEKGMISPAEFIPLAEYTGMIVPLGLWILEQACVSLKHFEEINPADEYPLFMGVNVSAQQLKSLDFIEEVKEILDKTGVNPARLKLEITESLIMEDPEFAANVLNRLKKLGVMLAIDDFGTGYSSLSYLHRFPFDTLKIDQSFVSSMMHNRDSQAIVQAITSLAHNLGLKIIAEGIEEPEQLDRLRELSCEYGQGYFMSRPIPVDQASQVLQGNACFLVNNQPQSVRVNKG